MSSSTAPVYTDTRTVHTIRILLSDDTLSRIGIDDQVEILLEGRGMGRAPSPKRLSYTDLQRLLSTTP